jgi:hypothetical protein
LEAGFLFALLDQYFFALALVDEFMEEQKFTQVLDRDFFVLVK